MGSVMHKDIKNDDTSVSGRILYRGEFIYYLGSLIFGTGIALLAAGTAFVMIFKIHSKSAPGEIALTAILVALGIALILIGINMMMRQTKYGKYIMMVSSFMSLIAILIFVWSYYKNSWYYPLISYVIALYVVGFAMLVGNVFANLTVWVIHGKSEIAIEREDKTKLYSDEEIQRDIEEATRKSMELAASELQFELGDSDIKNIKLSKAFYENRGTIVRVKDDINEALTLRETISPGEIEKWGSVGVDKVSMQLAKALDEKTAEKGRFGDIKERIERGWERFTRFLRLR